MLDCLCDGMVFGALKRCPTCKNGQLVYFSGIGYCCQGRDTWALCNSVFDNPRRRLFAIPTALKEKYKFL